MPKKESKPSKKTSTKPKASPSKGKVGPALVVVESPAKERTISRLLKGEYVVKSSFGHVRDLPVRKIGVKVDQGFAPEYVVLPRAKKILSELKSLVSRSPYVYLATDPDREGESIAWHLVEMLHLNEDQIRRITFHEITAAAISEALSSPRLIDEHLVQAQQARRVIDRLVGYKLSPLLWAKIQSGLSAGRVQSVAVRLLTEREKEIKDFASEKFWTLAALLEKAGTPPAFEAKLILWKGQKIEVTKTFDLFEEQYRVRLTVLQKPAQLQEIQDVISKGVFKVVKVEKKEVRRRPSPPFSTSTLQQAASQKLGFAAERTMRVAQTLYEGVDLGTPDPVGLITYMRTDSFSISTSAAEEAARFLREKFGPTYVPKEPPVYQTKAQRAQEAHEAIRPTSILRTPDQVRPYLNHDQSRLYDLVWKRFAASQMTEALYDTVSADIESGPALFHATGRSLKFDGFLRVFMGNFSSQEETDESEAAEEEEGRLPLLVQGDVVSLVSFKPEEHQSSPPPHYNEASLIRAMEKHGIGRPSTYAPTIKTIVDRGYVRRGIKDRKLLPSELGILVTEKLKKYFPEVVSLTYTAEVEERLDSVAEGREMWDRVVREFYAPFLKSLEAASREMEVSKLEPQKTDEKCPLCGEMMLIRESRFGKYLSCSAFPKCKGKIQLNAEGQKVVLETTGELCDMCGKPLVIRTGRKGRFLACSGYPACKTTFSLDAEGKKIESSRPLATSRPCNKCQRPFWIRQGKRGYFLACSGFPKCRNLRPVSKEEGGKLRAEAEMLLAQLKAQRST
ncbi:MAG: type I DNA topoisomerase [Elusimicrobia bacterium]|nr:type I DNA topoisomerase [Elusimicrobiota bacterium]